MAVETKNTDNNRTYDRAEQVFNRAEDTMYTLFDGSRKAFQAMFEFNRAQINTSLEMARDIQEESLRLTDAWFDQVTKFQKNTFKTVQDYSHKYQDVTERAVKENQVRFEESVDQTINMVTPGARRK